MTTFRASGLQVTYGDLVALHDLDLTLSSGAMLAVTGPSGAGKSSLLWALASTVPAAGRVEVDGLPLADREASARAGVVLVPQGNGLARSLTARENVLIPLLAQGVPAGEAAVRAEEALVRVGLEESGNHLVEELSGGQQQRVALARAFAARADVVLADEPTSDLDAGNRGRVITALREEAVRGAVVVMSTHDPEAAAECDAELALDEGRASWPRPLESASPSAPGHPGAT